MVKRFAWMRTPLVLFIAAMLIVVAFSLGYVLHPV